MICCPSFDQTLRPWDPKIPISGDLATMFKCVKSFWICYDRKAYKTLDIGQMLLWQLNWRGKMFSHSLRLCARSELFRCVNCSVWIAINLGLTCHTWDLSDHYQPSEIVAIQTWFFFNHCLFFLLVLDYCQGSILMCEDLSCVFSDFFNIYVWWNPHYGRNLFKIKSVT